MATLLNGDFNLTLRKIYALYLADGWTRVPVIEQRLDIIRPDDLSIDDRRNARDYYYRLVSNYSTELHALFHCLLDDMRSLSFRHASGLVDALMFMQNIFATALWRYELVIGEELETFTRCFDRLDVTSERRRLYDEAQKRTPRIR
jgi:hypothetical protein